MSKGYTTEALVEEYLGETIDTTTVPTTAAVADFIEWAEKIIDVNTRSSFTSATATQELHDGDGTPAFYTIYKPIISVTTFQEETAGLGQTASWTTRTEGRTSADSFVVYPNEGRLYFWTDIPADGTQNTRITYNYGYATVPKDVQRLATLLVVREIVRARVADSAYSSQESIRVGPIEIGTTNSASASIPNQLDMEIESMWETIGKFRSNLY